MLHSSIIIFNNRRTHLLFFFRSPPMCLCYFFLLSSVKCIEQHKNFTITRFSSSMSQFFLQTTLTFTFISRILIVLTAHHNLCVIHQLTLSEREKKRQRPSYYHKRLKQPIRRITLLSTHSFFFLLLVFAKISRLRERDLHRNMMHNYMCGRDDNTI